MSDEEDNEEGDGFKVISPENRLPALKDLIINLDARHSEKLNKENKRV